MCRLDRLDIIFVYICRQVIWKLVRTVYNIRVCLDFSLGQTIYLRKCNYSEHVCLKNKLKNRTQNNKKQNTKNTKNTKVIYENRSWRTVDCFSCSVEARPLALPRQNNTNNLRHSALFSEMTSQNFVLFCEILRILCSYFVLFLRVLCFKRAFWTVSLYCFKWLLQNRLCERHGGAHSGWFLHFYYFEPPIFQLSVL